MTKEHKRQIDIEQLGIIVTILMVMMIFSLIFMWWGAHTSCKDGGGTLEGNPLYWICLQNCSNVPLQQPGYYLYNPVTFNLSMFNQSNDSKFINGSQ